jgi:hypothetical protein
MYSLHNLFKWNLLMRIGSQAPRDAQRDDTMSAREERLQRKGSVPLVKSWEVWLLRRMKNTLSRLRRIQR